MSRRNKIHPQLSFQQKFRSYASIYNGIIRDTLTNAEEAIVDQLFAAEVSVVTDKETNQINISQLKHLIRGHLQAGSICEITRFQILGDHRVEYKTSMAGLDGVESMVHSVATIDKNSNKIVSIEPFNKDGTARSLFEMKFREYFALYDGSSKVFGKAEEQIFMSLFAEDFSVTVGEQVYNRQQWMKAIKACIKGGMQIDVLKFSFAPKSTEYFEYKLRVSSTNDKEGEGGVILNSVGCVVSGKFASFSPSSDKAYLSVFLNTLSVPTQHTCDNEDRAAEKKRKKKTRGERRGIVRLWAPAGWDRKGFGMV